MWLGPSAARSSMALTSRKRVPSKQDVGSRAKEQDAPNEVLKPCPEPESNPAVPAVHPLAAPTLAPVKVATTTTEGEDTHSHWIYGTATCDIHEVDGPDGQSPLATEGQRLLLVFPQKVDSETGRVEMRLKLVHPRTAQMKYVWIEVYSGVDTGRRSVTHFSTTPTGSR